jgi:hypothetical protein
MVENSGGLGGPPKMIRRIEAQVASLKVPLGRTQNRRIGLPGISYLRSFEHGERSNPIMPSYCDM